MAGGDQRHGKEPAEAVAPAEDKFPEGMRVLAVDDDSVCRRVLEGLLRMCKYNVTVVADGKTALEMLREGGDEQFDLVITDVHMPDMDGFKLLELIGLEMDLPVIMLSVNGEKETVLKGITHGACDYLVKPVHVKELRNIWQHVIRKNPGVMNHSGSDSDDSDPRVEQPVIVEGEAHGAKRKKCSKKKKKHDGDESESTRVQTRKKPRVSWTGELHNRFLDVVNHLGVDKAVPKMILQLMDVENLTRESVASHLQKYRLYLKRVTDDPRKSGPLGNSFDRKNVSDYMNTNHLASSGNYHEHHTGWPSSSAVGFSSGPKNLYSAPSMLGAHDVPLPSMNWTTGTVGHGRGMPGQAVPWLPDAGKGGASDPPVNSFTNPMMDAVPRPRYRDPYTGVLREKLLEASNVVAPSSHPAGNSSLAMPNGGLLGPVNHFPVQPPELVSQFFSQMNAAPPVVSTHREAQFPHLVGSPSNPWQNMVPSGFDAHMEGTPLSQSQVNFPLINQLPGFGASPGQMPMFQNEQQNPMAGINNNTTTLSAAFSEPMTPLFNMLSNMAPVEMPGANFSPMTQMVNAGSTSSPLPNIQTAGSSVAPPPTQTVNGGSISPALPDLPDSSAAQTRMLNPGDASGILPVQEGPAADEQALDDQLPNYTNPYFLEDIFNGMLNQQEFNGDAIFGGEF